MGKTNTLNGPEGQALIEQIVALPPTTRFLVTEHLKTKMELGILKKDVGQLEERMAALESGKQK